MNQTEWIAEFELKLKQLLAAEISGEDFVARYDELMADEWPDEVGQESDLYSLLDEYQMEFAMYVENPQWRKQHDGYFGEERLISLAGELAHKLKLQYH